MLNVVAIIRLCFGPAAADHDRQKRCFVPHRMRPRDAATPTARVQADWLDVAAWDRTAEFVCKYFQKGSLIAIDGRLQSRQYQDKNGNNRTAIEIVANNVNFAALNQNAAPMGDAGYGAPMAAPAARPAVQANFCAELFCRQQ